MKIDVVKVLGIVVIAGAVSLFGVGCGEKSSGGSVEKAGAAVDKAAEKTVEGVGTAVKKTGEGIEKAGKAVEKASDDMKK